MNARLLLPPSVLALLVGMATAGLGAPQTKADRGRDIADRRQVFIDGRFLQSVRNVTLRVHRPQKTGERDIVPDRPWERSLKAGTVMRWRGVYRMWYLAMAKRRRNSDYDGVTVAYARSKDGRHWVEPDLGLAEFDGSRNNNIVLGDGAGGVSGGVSGGMVFRNPRGGPQARLVMVVRDPAYGKGVHLFTSPDGLHWKLAVRNAITWHGPQAQLDTQNVIVWDAQRQRYVAYVRRNLRLGGNPAATGVHASWNTRKGPRLRTVAWASSLTLAGFPPVEEMPVVLGPDDLDPHFFDSRVDRTIFYYDYYTAETFPYPWAQDAWYMFPSGYYHYQPEVQHVFAQRPFPLNAGDLDVRFAASRDGVHWRRFDRRAFVPLGMKGSFDSRRIYMLYGVVPAPNPNQLYLYYLGTDQTHGWNRDARNNRALTAAGLAPARNTRVISRLVIRRDGFISAHGAYAGGQFTTPVLRFKGDELVLNVDTSAGGGVRVEIQGPHHEAIPGFSLRACDLIHSTNAINRRVTWNGRGDVAALAGRPIRLRFYLRDADLYAFQFRQARPPANRPDAGPESSTRAAASPR